MPPLPRMRWAASGFTLIDLQLGRCSVDNEKTQFFSEHAVVYFFTIEDANFTIVWYMR